MSPTIADTSDVVAPKSDSKNRTVPESEMSPTIADTSDVVAPKSDSKNRTVPESAFSYYLCYMFFLYLLKHINLAFCKKKKNHRIKTHLLLIQKFAQSYFLGLYVEINMLKLNSIFAIQRDLELLRLIHNSKIGLN